MLIVALVLAVIGLAALVTAVVTSNELVAWVCIAASVLGVILLIIDAIRERQRGGTGEADAAADEAVAGDGDSIERTYQNFDAEYPDEDETPQAAATPSDAGDSTSATDQANTEVAKTDEAEHPGPADAGESAEAKPDSAPGPESEVKPEAQQQSESETKPSANG